MQICNVDHCGQNWNQLLCTRGTDLHACGWVGQTTRTKQDHHCFFTGVQARSPERSKIVHVETSPFGCCFPLTSDFKYALDSYEQKTTRSQQQKVCAQGAVGLEHVTLGRRGPAPPAAQEKKLHHFLSSRRWATKIPRTAHRENQEERQETEGNQKDNKKERDRQTTQREKNALKESEREKGES